MDSHLEAYASILLRKLLLYPELGHIVAFIPQCILICLWHIFVFSKFSNFYTVFPNRFWWLGWYFRNSIFQPRPPKKLNNVGGLNVFYLLIYLFADVALGPHFCTVHILLHVRCRRKPIWTCTGLNLMFISTQIILSQRQNRSVSRPPPNGIWKYGMSRTKAFIGRTKGGWKFCKINNFPLKMTRAPALKNVCVKSIGQIKLKLTIQLPCAKMHTGPSSNHWQGTVCSGISHGTLISTPNPCKYIIFQVVALFSNLPSRISLHILLSGIFGNPLTPLLKSFGIKIYFFL